MRIADWRETEIRCPLPVLLTLPAAVLFNCADSYLSAFFALMLHEISHAVMARRLGYSVTSLEIQPFGFIAKTENAPSSPAEAAAIYLSGPLVSLTTALLSAGLMYITGKALPALRQFAVFNLILGIVNLIPVLPLDGGRLFVSFFSKSSSAKKTIKLFSALGIGFGIVGIIFGIFVFIRGSRNFTLIITGFFIALAAAGELKNTVFINTKNKLHRLSRLRRGQTALRVYAAAVKSQSSVREALSALPSAGYNIVLMTDRNGKVCGMLDEAEITEALAGGKADVSLDEIFAENGSRNLPVSCTCTQEKYRKF